MRNLATEPSRRLAAFPVHMECSDLTAFLRRMHETLLRNPGFNKVPNTMQTSFYPFPKLLCAAMALGFMIDCSADSLAPPPYDIRDTRYVNIASGHVSPNLEDVRIGDATFGLTHSISSFSSSFVNYDGAGPLGFRDRFYGGAQKDVFSKPLGLENDPNSWIYCMRVFDIGGSFDFAYSADGTTFTAMNGDPRNTLVFVPNVGLVWTKPDGTVVTFGPALASFNAATAGIHGGFPLSSIIYPNGFTVQVYGNDPVRGATTNTGYQLKYLYVQNTAPVDGDDPTNTEIPAANSLNWSSTMPAAVVAINNAIDYCQPSGPEFTGVLSVACPGLTTTWPAANYSWPNGMPRAMYLRDASFKVADSLGRVTEYMHHPYEKPAILNDPQFRVPRLVGIKSWNSSVADIAYDYVTKTLGYDTSSGMGFGYPVFFAGPIAQLTSSTYAGDTVGYTVANHVNQGSSQWVNTGGDARGANRVYYDIAYGIYEADLWDRTVTFEKNLKNRVLQVSDASSLTTIYGYDARYNVNSIVVNGVTTKTALYPDTCTNRKTCNQAIWIKDGNGNQTDFEYDPNSGSVSRVRRPADKLGGVRPETRYAYSPKYAYYKNASGTVQAAATPVYLLSREWTCAQTAMLADGSGCSGGASDLISTDYDYGQVNTPNNLQLRGVSVTAYVAGAPQTHRTCYAYDVYGNKIGQTSPNAGLASCY